MAISESLFTMENVNQPLRFIKYAMKHLNGKNSQNMIVTTYLKMDIKTLFKRIIFAETQTRTGFQQFVKNTTIG